MPRSAAKLTVSRQWQILQKLPRRAPGLTASELADHLRHDRGFTVTKRTIERDLVELATLFPITSHTDTKPFRWRWAEGARTDLSGLDLAEALGLVLAEQTVTPLLPASLLRVLAPLFALARRQLSALDAHRFARWPGKVRQVSPALNLLPPRVRPEVLAAVQESLFDETQLQVAYTGPEAPKAKPLTLHPLCLVRRGPVLYLAATAFDYDDIRLYSLHRMTRPRRLDAPRRVPADYDPDAYLRTGAMDFDPGELVPLVARVSNELAIYLTETPLSSDQKILSRGAGHELRATVRDSWQLRFWILSQGPALTVEQPATLRHAIHNQIHAALIAYEHRPAD